MNLIEKAERQIEADRARLKKLEAENAALRSILADIRKAMTCVECGEWLLLGHEEWCDFADVLGRDSHEG